ncbi:copper chaperone PCu(A)C [Streptomyces sp. IBSBF 2953]|uniref:copper chaperone PCu(A)C n=1 Tax=Streptomyces TaxID=1883 RepID=UPI002119C20D|nr:copper chaperone PCu(A)C [Streptomyces scabiei]MCQ9181984.1 copper chaperone PCu(A)C [Streptomyces hayashii]MDX3113388.1 copper chaperone PCu(A)C [Streptomyces scabiei]
MVTGTLLLAGCGSDSPGAPDLSVQAAYIPQPVSDTMAAGFLTIVNKGDAKDELTSVTSSAAGHVTLHRTVGSSMEQVSSLDVPAHGQLVFKSGGNHLMFEMLKSRPVQGETVTVQLHFAASDPLKVEIPVESATYIPKTGH